MGFESMGTTIRYYQIKTVEDFLSMASALESEKDSYFRGQSNFNWPIQNSLHRHKIAREERGLKAPNEGLMIRKFLELFPGKPSVDGNVWPILAEMQHLGVPTRMLDFSRNFWVASFFAIVESSFSSDAKAFDSLVFSCHKQLIKDEPPLVTLSELESFSERKRANITFPLYQYLNPNDVARMKEQDGVLIFMHDPYEDLHYKFAIVNNWEVIRTERGIYDIKEQWERSTGLTVFRFTFAIEDFLKVKKEMRKKQIDDLFLFPDDQGKIMSIKNLLEE